MQVKILITVLAIFLGMKLAKAECEMIDGNPDFAFKLSCKNGIYSFTDIQERSNGGIFSLVGSKTNAENFCFLMGLSYDGHVKKSTIIPRRVITIGGTEFKSTEQLAYVNCL